MKRTISCSNSASAACSLSLSRFAQRVAIGSLALVLGLAAISALPSAAATPICVSSIAMCTDATVYLYDAGNTPVLAPNATITEGGVYTDSGFIGTINADYMIVDASNNIVGYVTYPSPG
jgi:hypothetical protein